MKPTEKKEQAPFANYTHFSNYYKTIFDMFFATMPQEEKDWFLGETTFTDEPANSETNCFNKYDALKHIFTESLDHWTKQIVKEKVEAAMKAQRAREADEEKAKLEKARKDDLAALKKLIDEYNKKYEAHIKTNDDMIKDYENIIEDICNSFDAWSKKEPPKNYVKVDSLDKLYNMLFKGI